MPVRTIKINKTVNLGLREQPQHIELASDKK